ncbi:hypothetical protein BV20DRAFT_74147 [Pilatotrama ljubarskyi]|nr:hypothetical protein BV20DRAFT_74147 [Pilatotrama ljubarskyi]
MLTRGAAGRSEFWSRGYFSYPVVTKHLIELGKRVCLAIRRMHHLQSVWLKGTIWDAATFEHLGSLTSLTAFTLECGWVTTRYVPRRDLQCRPSLLCPNCSCPSSTAKAPSSWATRIPSTGSTYTQTRRERLQETFAPLPHFRRLTQLTVVNDEEMERRIGDRAAYPDGDGYVSEPQGLSDGPTYFAPTLSATPCLRTFQVSIDVVIQLDDEFLSKLAQSLPHLEVLSLVPWKRLGFSFEERSYEQRFGGGDVDGGQGCLDEPAYFPSPSRLSPLAASSPGCGRLTKLRLAVKAAFRGSLQDRPHRLDMYYRPSELPCQLELWTTPPNPAVSDDVVVVVDFFAPVFPALEEFQVRLPITHSVPDNAMYGETSESDDACARWDAVLDSRLRDRLEGLRVAPVVC